jgi:hypothetical protein
MNGHLLSHFMYADDACVLASSPAGLQKLLNICSDYADNNTIIYKQCSLKATDSSVLATNLPCDQFVASSLESVAFRLHCLF